MIKEVYKINNKNVLIYCEIEDYSKRIKNWLSPFPIMYQFNYDFYLKIYTNKTIIKQFGDEMLIKGKLKHTDLYPLIYNLIANIYLSKNNLLIHSCVLCYNNNAVLILGDFNSGKTTLCLEGLKNNMTIASTDQSILSFNNNELTFIKGSIFMKIDKNQSNFINTNYKNIKIKYIINLIGLCDNGLSSFTKVKDKDIITKIIFKYGTWHADIPLFTNDLLLNIDRIKIKKFINKINLPLYNVRGCKEDLIRIIKEMLE